MYKTLLIAGPIFLIVSLLGLSLINPNITGNFSYSDFQNNKAPDLIKYKQDYNKLNVSSNLCFDSDSGKNYYKKGHISGLLSGDQKHSAWDSCIPIDWIPGNKLREYYCDSEGYVKAIDISCVKGFICYKGFCQKKSLLDSNRIYVGCTNPFAENYDPKANADNNEYASTKYGLCLNANKLPSLPDPQYIIDNNLKDTEIIQTKEGNIMVIAPKGYSAILTKHISDLKYCYKLIPSFIGINPYLSGIILRIYISNENSNLGAYLWEKGIIVYIKSQDRKSVV